MRKEVVVLMNWEFPVHNRRIKGTVFIVKYFSLLLPLVLGL